MQNVRLDSGDHLKWNSLKQFLFQQFLKGLVRLSELALGKLHHIHASSSYSFSSAAVFYV